MRIVYAILCFGTQEEATDIIHKALNGLKSDDAAEKLIDLFSRTRNNRDFIEMVKKIRLF